MDDARAERLRRERERRPVFFPSHPPRAGWTSARTVVLLAILLFGAIVWVPAALFERVPVGGHVDGRLVAWSAPPLSVFLVIVPGGLLDILRRRKAQAALRLRPGEPWLADHRWNPQGVSRPAFSRIPVIPAVAGLLFESVMLLLAATAHDPVIWFFAACCVTPWAYALWKIFGVGGTRLHFTRFPYRTGERVTLCFGGGPDAANFERIGYSLRLLSERPGSIPPWHIVSTVMELAPLPTDDLLPGPDQDVVLAFDVPADAPGTRLSDDLPRWWVLDVAGMTSAGPYSESFLVPIYEKPAAPAA